MSSPDSMSDQASTERPADFGLHNMVAFGHGTVFLSHLPMFMAPHDAQLLLEVALEDADGSLHDVWAAERDDHPDERLYTMMPEEFALSSLYAGDPPERDTFGATFFRGHLERGGEVIPGLAEVKVRITEVVFASRFDRRSRPEDLTYLVVGHGEELFLVHVIRQPPDFDQILSVRLGGPLPGEAELKAGIRVDFPGRANTAEARLRDGETATARGHVTGAHRFLDLELVEVRELYFEEGELATPEGTFEPTPLETEGGFGN